MAKKKLAPKKVVVTFQIEGDLLERLDEVAKLEERSRSSAIRQLVIRALEAQEKTA